MSCHPLTVLVIYFLLCILHSKISGAKDKENKRQQALKLVQRLWENVVLLSDAYISNLTSKPENLIFDAARLETWSF